MKVDTKRSCQRRKHCGRVAGAVLGLAAGSVGAQTTAASGSTGLAADPNPYYLGVSEAITHDSNVYQVPSGPSDNYSSTSLFGGFDQQISRQRVFGRASVSLNRYQDQTQLNNTSYDLSTGIDWATIANISGNLSAGLNRRLAAPAASVSTPDAVKNVADTESVAGRLRWGGPALLTLEGGGSYAKLDYSDPAYASSETRQESADIGLYYRPGAFLRVGVAARRTRTRTPRALFDSSSGSYQSNTLDGKNIDLIADYVATGQITANGRVSYTRQTSSSISSADFSGITGALGVNWQTTAKISLQFDLSRDAGFDTSLYNAYPVSQNPAVPATSPVTGLYENNRTTTTAGLGATYAATSRITATAGVRYTRADLVSTVTSSGSAVNAPGSTDVLRSVNLGANYSIGRNWGVGCTFGHDSREVSGAFAYAYVANRVGCSTQFVWR